MSMFPNPGFRSQPFSASAIGGLQVFTARAESFTDIRDAYSGTPADRTDLSVATVLGAVYAPFFLAEDFGNVVGYDNSQDAVVWAEFSGAVLQSLSYEQANNLFCRNVVNGRFQGGEHGTDRELSPDVTIGMTPEQYEVYGIVLETLDPDGEMREHLARLYKLCINLFRIGVEPFTDPISARTHTPHTPDGSFLSSEERFEAAGASAENRLTIYSAEVTSFLTERATIGERFDVLNLSNIREWTLSSAVRGGTGSGLTSFDKRLSLPYDGGQRLYETSPGSANAEQLQVALSHSISELVTSVINPGGVIYEHNSDPEGRLDVLRLDRNDWVIEVRGMRSEEPFEPARSDHIPPRSAVRYIRSGANDIDDTNNS